MHRNPFFPEAEVGGIGPWGSVRQCIPITSPKKTLCAWVFCFLEGRDPGIKVVLGGLSCMSKQFVEKNFNGPAGITSPGGVQLVK